jgi:hypothetical protein
VKVKEKEVLFVSFSGGRTSAYMCWYLIKYWSHKYRFIFVFANTGLEHEETLIFVDKVDKWLGLNLVWLEAAIHDTDQEGTTSKIVSFDTAHRGNRLWHDMCRVYGIPNAAYPHCNRELKLQPIKHYKTTQGFKRLHLCAIGIRSDEFDRISVSAEKEGLIYPLVRYQDTTKPEVMHWWDGQAFDLNIPEHKGNCVTCWKKSDRKLFTLAREDKSLFDSFDELESLYGHVKAPDKKRVFFRRHRSTKEILKASEADFVPFVEIMPELQLRLITDDAFEIDDLDIESDCGAASCELG